MSIFKRFKILALVGVQLLMFQSMPAYAQFPTVDFAAIKESVMGKIELVKQSKIVKDVTEQAGKLNSAIGDAKSSISKYAGDNLAKAKEKAEKLKKAKERLEKQKEKIEKAKEKAEKMKEKAEKAKKAMADAQKKVQEAKDKVNEAKQLASDVKSKVDEAKSMVSDVQSTVANAKSMAQNAVSDAKGMVNDAKGMAQNAVSQAQSMANDARGMAQSAVSDARGMLDSSGLPLQRAVAGNNMQMDGYAPAMYGNYQDFGGAEDSFVDDYVAAYEAGINSDSKIYDRMPVEQGSYDMIPTNRLNNSGAAVMQSAPMTSTGKVINRQAFGSGQNRAVSGGLSQQQTVMPAERESLGVMKENMSQGVAPRAELESLNTNVQAANLKDSMAQRPQSTLQAVEGMSASSEKAVAARAGLEGLKADKLQGKADAMLAKGTAKAEAQALKADAKEAAKAEIQSSKAGLSSLKDSIAQGKAAGSQTQERLNTSAAQKEELLNKANNIKDSMAQRPQSTLQAVEGVSASTEKAVAARAGLESLKADKLQGKADAMLAKETAKAEAQALKADAKEAAKAEIQSSKAGLSSLKDNIAQSKATVSQAQERLNTSAKEKSSELQGKLDAVKAETQAVKANATAVKADVKAIQSEAKPVNTNGGFRQRAVINKGLGKGAWLDKAETIKVSVYKASETLAFGSGDPKDTIVDNGEFEETIITESMSEYCGLGKDDLGDVTKLQDCIKKLLKEKSDADNQVAEGGNATYNKMVSELAISVIGESLAMKNIAANYQDKLEKQDEDLGSASTGRDDSAALAMTDKELQYVINKLLTMQSTMLSVNALLQIGSLDYSAFEEDEGE